MACMGLDHQRMSWGTGKTESQELTMWGDAETHSMQQLLFSSGGVFSPTSRSVVTIHRSLAGDDDELQLP